MSKNETPGATVVLVGGPNAGKTNYLGRLWLALDAETGVIVKNGLPAQVDYLRTIAASLNSGVFAQRTAPGVFESTSIPVKWGAGPSFGELVVPDCAGEQWEKIHAQRQWNSNWEQAAASMVGCIVFFRGTSDHNVQALNWTNDSEVMTCLEQETAAASEPIALPTQVVLADSLHCLATAYRDIQGSDKPLPVSVLLSAWDLAPVEFRKADPNVYLSSQLPLLHDFLWGNPLLFRPKSFGVSIAGGILTEEHTQFMKQYFAQGPTNSGYVVFANGADVVTSHDLTLPLAWAFGCNCPDFPFEGSDDA